MKIHIASQLKPFSHKPGTHVLIPGGLWTAIVYPTCLKLVRDSQTVYKLNFLVTQAATDFTIIQDLEKKFVKVFFRAKEGYFRYHLKYKNSKLCFHLEKAQNGLTFDLYENSEPIRMTLKPKETLDFEITDKVSLEKSLEKLSFGCHKKQDWQLIQKRNNPSEYLPFWFYLGQITPSQENFEKRGALKHLSEVEHFLSKGQEKEVVLKRLSDVFQAGFKELLVPCLYDEQHLGLFKSCDENNTLACNVLSLGYKIIRGFFLTYEDNTLSILTNLPKDFHCGRLVNLTEKGLIIDLEWSKKLLKKMKIQVIESQKVHFKFQKSLKSYRLKIAKKDHGKRVNTSDPIFFQEGNTYLFDNFRK